MGNIYNRNPEEVGHTPIVDTTSVPAQSSAVGRFFYILCSILTLGIMPYTINKRINTMQNDIQRNIADIDTQLIRRKDLLTKMFETVKGYAKHEHETLTEIAEMRTRMNQIPVDESGRAELENMSNSVFGRLMMVQENYPELKADRMFNNLMDEEVNTENNIAATRRFYNSTVNEYNTYIMVWPSNATAHRRRLTTYSLTAATKEQKQDVEIKF